MMAGKMWAWVALALCWTSSQENTDSVGSQDKKNKLVPHAVAWAQINILLIQ